MKRRGKRSMQIFILVVVLIIALFIIFIKLPFSPAKTEFNEAVNNIVSNTEMYPEAFTEKDIENFPLPVQSYFRYCGYLGTPKMSYMKASFTDVDFKLSKRTTKINYIQYNFVKTPERFAYIDSSLYGIPFEGFDSYKGGEGSMKGKLAKVVTLFDQRGKAMDKSCLATVLAECLLVPNVALQDYIKWEAIDDTHAKAVISWRGISVKGVFTFDENGELLTFVTNDRVATNMDGSAREAAWSAIYSDYQNINGLKQPRVLQSIWHYPEGDCVYFNENMSGVTIEYY